jgi:uncharacterized membrane protein
VSRYEWLLFLHVTGAFLLLGGTAVAGLLTFDAMRRERPSEIALLLGLIRFGVSALMAGSLLTPVFGLWLVHDVGYGYGDGWIVAAIILWAVGNAAGGAGGRRAERAQRLAEQLAAQGDAPSAELRARVRDPFGILLNYGSGLIILALLALMIWKPGA